MSASDINDRATAYVITTLVPRKNAAQPRKDPRKNADAILGPMASRQWLELAASHMDTLAGIADRLGLTDEALLILARTHAAFPEPITVYGRARVYSVDEVIDFHMGVGRIYGRGRTIAGGRSRV